MSVLGPTQLLDETAVTHSLYFTGSFSSPVSTLKLSPGTCPHLELQLDAGHGGVEKDLCEIAQVMFGWEGKLATRLELTATNVSDIKDMYPNKPDLQR